MKSIDTKAAGTLMLVAAVQFMLAMIIAEASYPNYSVSNNFISDLGVGSTAVLFNSAVALLGLMTIAAGYFVYRGLGPKLLAVLLILTGIGALGVGFFPETAGRIHTGASLVTFLFGALSAIASYKLGNKPINYASVLLGLMAIAALILFGSGNYVGIGRGGMERMIAYPVLLWGAGFGGYLINQRDYSKNPAQSKSS